MERSAMRERSSRISLRSLRATDLHTRIKSPGGGAAGAWITGSEEERADQYLATTATGPLPQLNRQFRAMRAAMKSAFSVASSLKTPAPAPGNVENVLQ